jgi:hypothetical protein
VASSWRGFGVTSARRLPRLWSKTWSCGSIGSPEKSSRRAFCHKTRSAARQVEARIAHLAGAAADAAQPVIFFQ